MTLTEMRRELFLRDIQLTKSLGQHFLHDGNQLRRIADAANLTPADAVLEVGPGLGPLTELLLARAGEVLAIEMDLRLVTALQERFKDTRLQLQHADALAWLRTNPRDWTAWKIVSNLPYSVASPLLVELALMPLPPRSMTVTLQLEVARRMMAAADDEDYGVLTLLIQLRYAPRALIKIPRASFYPEPDVDSACVSLERRETKLIEPELRPAFVRLVKLGFSQRRKMMMKLLKQNWPAEKLETAYSELGLHPQIRAEKVNLEQFIALTRLLAGAG
jgi:16S rRNA (adenine1518-N6/adenine1519-N6)-dimethyltransferase